MDIAIRGRNVEVPESMRAVVAEKVTRAARMFDGMDRAEVHLSEERNPRIADKDACEVAMTGHGRTLRARATGPDVATAVDRAVDKLTHRMEKVKGKLIGRSHPRRNGSLDSSPVGTRED
ncbi:MAG TPA: ribosome-associated translation inhibitor RaiA [Acidimicrobiales bacterium]|nr:ribosome-associated translation inhibitor RaiA [Acidimicrobiales bacterium]